MIRLGINVPNFGPQTDARALLSWTRFAESNGFDAIVLSDHVAPTSRTMVSSMSSLCPAADGTNLAP